MQKQTLTILGLGIIGLIGGYFLIGSLNTVKEKSPALLDNISIFPIEHASIVINWDDDMLLVDPVGDISLYDEHGTPTMIMVTDIHSDHLSTSTLQRLDTEKSIFVTPQAVMDQLGGSVYFGEIEVMNNGETEELLGYTVTAVAMYNVPETDDSFHPKGRGNGYVIEKDNVRIYVAGDTGNHRLIRGLKDIDVAFVPMNEPYTMSEKDAAKAVLAFAPKIVYPYHYKEQDGLNDIEKFKDLISKDNPDIEVRIVDWYPKRELEKATIQIEGANTSIRKVSE